MTTPGPMTYTLPDAAERLGGPFTIDFLKKHLADLPHLKTGKGTGRSGRVAFSERQLEQIVAMFTVDPAPVADPAEFPSMVTRRGSARRQEQPAAGHPSRAASGVTPLRRTAHAGR